MFATLPPGNTPIFATWTHGGWQPYDGVQSLEFVFKHIQTVMQAPNAGWKKNDDATPPQPLSQLLQLETRLSYAAPCTSWAAREADGQFAPRCVRHCDQEAKCAAFRCPVPRFYTDHQ